jgi:adenosylhomocysteine nucleosidase
MKIGIMGAMPEEVLQLRHHMAERSVETRGMREYISGDISGKSVTLVFSRWGKVAASATATTLIERYGVDLLVFTGVAGGVDPVLNIGDIVVADSLVQHDMDVSAVAGIEKFEIPLLGLSSFDVDERYVSKARGAAEAYLTQNLRADVAAEALDAFHITTPKVLTGTIASGDQFIADHSIVEHLCQAFPRVKCVEMEGAAAAQVAHEYSIPCLVLRTISDKADKSAAVDFPKFLTTIASHFTCGSVLRLIECLD